ncbi:MAG: molybdopterin molybdotransferase MoeA [Burkholderiaceae bacterium]|jgi:molybdopterin molybdotransferase|nr:molybdopterin molybdotransferase MoeA [Burkholderiaceae bacterium]
MDSNTPPLPAEQARRIISELVRPLEGTEHVPLKEALLRVLAEDVAAPIDVPSRDNAAMDGYAFSAAALKPDMTHTLKVAGAVLAGHPFEGAVSPGECVRIMTGAPVPAGCDTVIPQENVTAKDGVIMMEASAFSPGDNVRLRGEDLKEGQICLRGGTLLKPAHIGLLASLGMAQALVKRRPKVAIFSTGDELYPVGSPLPEGGIYDSNRYSLYGMVKRLGCDVLDMGVIRDEPALIRAAFLEAARQADAVITTGGVSVGTADYTGQILSEIADMAFWRINMRPGQPTAFGRIHAGGKETIVFGLPGNPVAVMAAFYFFARDALYYLMGTRPAPLPRIAATSLSPLTKRLGRTEFQRGILAQNERGNWTVRTTGPQGSGILSSMAQANGMIVLPPECEAVPPGETVEVIPFEGLV